MAGIMAGDRSPAGHPTAPHLKLMTTVCLIQFARPSERVRHYLGYTAELEARVEQHRNGTGTRLLQVITQVGYRLRCLAHMGWRA